MRRRVWVDERVEEQGELNEERVWGGWDERVGGGEGRGEDGG